jgi:HSP20 family molecular chaperone IbpA
VAVEINTYFPAGLAGNIELTAISRELIVKGVHEHKKADEDEKLRWSELRHSDVYRRVPLPADVDPTRSRPNSMAC